MGGNHELVRGSFKKYVVFSGRSRCKEYWMFTLINIIIFIVIAAIEGFAGSPGIIATIYYLAVLIPSLSVTIRRLHDTGRSAWWLLIGLIPFIGGIIFIILVLDSQPGENKYGPNPKAAIA